MGFCKCGTRWVAQVCSPRGLRSVREPVVLCPLPRNSSAWVPPRAELRGGLGGRPRGAPGWFQAWPGVRTLAVSPHPCDLSPICQGPVMGNCSVFSVLSRSWPPLSPFLLFGSAGVPSEANAGLLFLGYLWRPQHRTLSEAVFRTVVRVDILIPLYRGGPFSRTRGRHQRQNQGSSIWLQSLSVASGLPVHQLLEDRDGGSFTCVPTAQTPDHHILPGHLLLLNGFSCLVLVEWETGQRTQVKGPLFSQLRGRQERLREEEAVVSPPQKL